jgi:mannose-6-phosphate isomerase-like protein (cupin superfamily)
MNKINILEKFSLIHSHWDPKIIIELNQQHIKLVKFKGEFDWHKHETEDELFMVIKGKFDMQFRDKTISLSENEIIVVPHGVEHCPKAEAEVQVLLFEPISTLNTGNVRTEKTKNNLKKI